MTDAQQNNQSVSFEKTRYQYCKELFERERERKETLERKAQMILSLVTLMLGVIYFKLDFFKNLKDIISNSSFKSFIALPLYGVLCILAICLLGALFSVLKSIKLQIYKEEHPKNFISSLFAPESDYLISENEVALYRATAMSYAIALEQNSDINDKKAIWVRYSWYSLIAAVIILAVFIALYGYVSIT